MTKLGNEKEKRTDRQTADRPISEFGHSIRPDFHASSALPSCADLRTCVCCFYKVHNVVHGAKQQQQGLPATWTTTSTIYEYIARIAADSAANPVTSLETHAYSCFSALSRHARTPPPRRRSWTCPCRPCYDVAIV